MTRKDFELIARVIKNADEVIDEDALEVLASMMAGALSETNPLFDRERFLKACQA